MVGTTRKVSSGQGPSQAEVNLNQRFLVEAGLHLKEFYGDRYRGAILFGSRATGKAGPDSDVDIAVLLEPPIRLIPDIRTAHQALSEFEDSHGWTIQAIPVDSHEFEKQDFHFYRKILNEGIPL